MKGLEKKLRKLAKCSLRNINADFARDWLASYGYTDEVQFWEAVSTLSSPTTQSMSTNMESALSKWGYTKTNLRDNFREWFNDIAFNTNGYVSDSAKKFFPNMKNITFMKRFDVKQGTLSANFSIGSGTATFTATRGASNPATYIDSSGLVVTTTTSNVPRFTGGFYNSTGFVSRPGIIIEGASTNLVPASAEFDDASWTATNVTVDDQTGDLNAPDGTATADLLTATNANGTVLLASAVTGATFSVWLRRKTGTGNIDITANGGTNYTTVTLVSGQWARFTVTAASASQKAGIRIVTSTDAVYAWGAQFENLVFATSYIPTTAGALTRNKENLSYVCSGNINISEKSVFGKFYHFQNRTGANTTTTLFETDADLVRLRSWDSAAGNVRFFPNGTQNSGVVAGANHAFVAGTSYVYTGVASHSSPYAKLYVDGSSIATYTVGDWTDLSLGTNFYIGENNAAGQQLYGTVKSICIFSDAKTAASVTAITNIMNS